MKLLISIVQKEDANQVASALTDKDYHVTKLTSSGGFLMSKNYVILCGVDDNEVNQVINIIEKNTSKRVEEVSQFKGMGGNLNLEDPVKVTVGGATIFVVNVDRFEKV